ncbi:unnamed protein product [Brachionus calyciflorus]|uniref:SHSP domain-containing protein n=1 Tax=Brachionus calyciflorus TaxID=104777 RepID=A0A813Q223_9BILA|nr:unnamed protein product [Brachionus calyciflorus]
MSLIPHSLFPRSLFDVDPFQRPLTAGMGPSVSALDVFDPFDELDRMMNRNLSWLNVPDFMRSLPSVEPRFPKKFRITADVSGYNPRSIKTEVSDDKKKLIIHGKEGESKQTGQDDYSLREFRKTYNLPENAETDKLASFVTANDRLVVEIPLKHTEPSESLLPRIVEGEGGAKQLSLNLNLPQSIDPSKIQVTCKDRDLIVQAEDKKEKEDTFSRTSFYSRTTLPENTDFKQLKCHFDHHKLSVSAPINPAIEPMQKSIPIELQGEMIEHAQSPSGEVKQQPTQPISQTQQQQQQQQPSQTKMSQEGRDIPVQREV